MQITSTSSAIKAAALAPAGPQQAAEAAPSGNGRKLDITSIPFKVVIETVGLGESQVGRILASVGGWSTNSAGDCSHGQNQYSGHYIKMISPEFKYGEDAFKNIATALEKVQAAGGRLGETGAMKILVRNTSLDVETFRELYRMHESVEPIVYNVGQNGTGYHVGHNTCNYKPGGWTLEHGNAKGNFYFCMPVSNIPQLSTHLAKATTIGDLEKALAGQDRFQYGGKHWGFLPRSPKIDANFAEFRYLTATLDADAVRGDVEMILGMLKTAHEGRWPKDLPAQSLSKFEKGAVDWRVFESFMREVMGGMPSADKVRAMFEKAGGKVDKPPVGKEDLDRLAQLREGGYRIEWGAGTLEAALLADRPVKITEPGQTSPYTVGAGSILPWMATEAGGAAPADPQARAMRPLLTDLRRDGVRFFARGEAQPLTSLQGPALMMSQGSLQAEVNGERRPIADSAAFEQLAFDVVSAKCPAETVALAQQADGLRKKGYAFSDPSGQAKLGSPYQLLNQLRSGALAVSLPGSSVRNVLSDATRATQFLAAEAGEVDGLPASTRQLLPLVGELQAAGYSFSHADGKVDPQARLCVPQAIEDGKLTITEPGMAPRPFSGDFVRWAHGTLGNGSQLDDAGRNLLKEWNALRTAGASLVDPNGRPVTRPVLGMLYAGETVRVQLPHGRQHTFDSVEGLTEFSRTRRNLLSDLTPENIMALQRLDGMRGESKLDLEVDGKPLQSPLQMAWLMADEQPMTITHRQGGTTSVTGYDAVRQLAATETSQTAELPPATASLLERLGGLEKNSVRFTVQGKPVALKTAQLAAFGQKSLKAELPRRIRWGVLFRKSITPTSPQDLEKIAHRLGA